MGRGGEGEVHLGIQTAGRCVLGRMRGHVFEGLQGGVALRGRIAHAAELAHGLGFEQADEARCVHRAGQIGVYGFLLHGGAGVGIVEGIVLDLHVGVSAAGAVDFGLAAVAGGIVGGDVAGAVHEHDALGGVHGGHAVGVARRRAAVYLIAGGVLYVVETGSAVLHHAHGIGARGHGLCLEGLDVGRVAHLVGQHAIEIIFDIDVGDGIKRITAAAGNGLEGQIARIGIVAFTRLADLDAVGAAGAVAPQGKAGAHVGFDPVMGQRDRTGGTAETHRERAAAGNEFARGGNAVVAHHRQIQPGGITQRGKVDPHHAVHGRGPRSQRRGSHLHVAYRSGGGIRRAACRQHDGDCAKGQHCAQPLPYVLWHLGRSSLAWFVILS